MLSSSFGAKAVLGLILILSLGIMDSNAKNIGRSTVVQLIELSRHGARSPFYNIWDYSQNWKIPVQTLTPIGQRQHYIIGQNIADQYKDSVFKGSLVYNEKTVSAVSTSSGRAQQSALAQLYGIYQKMGQNVSGTWKFEASTDLPPMAGQNVKHNQETLENLNGQNLPNSYQPISVLECSNPYILESYNNCPGYSVLKSKNYQSEVFKQFDASLKEFKKEFVEKFELKWNPEDVTVSNMANFWDSVVCDIYEQIKLPETFNEEFIQKLNYVYDFDQLYNNFNDQSGNLLKLQTSTFFQDLIDVLTNKGDIVFKFYSASDGNLNAFLIAAGVASYTADFEEWKNPTLTKTHQNAPFASTIFLEVSTNESNVKYVKFVYNGEAILLPGCETTQCGLYNEFIPFLEKFIIKDQNEFNRLCNPSAIAQQ